MRQCFAIVDFSLRKLGGCNVDAVDSVYLLITSQATAWLQPTLSSTQFSECDFQNIKISNIAAFADCPLDIG